MYTEPFLQRDDQTLNKLDTINSSWGIFIFSITSDFVGWQKQKKAKREAPQNKA